MKYKFLFSLLFSLILGGMDCNHNAVADDYACQVNTLIGTKGTWTDFLDISIREQLILTEWCNLLHLISLKGRGLSSIS